MCLFIKLLNFDLRCPKNSNFTGEQCKVFSLYSSGFSFFLIGEGGTGKSFVLKEIIQHARIKLGNEGIAVTALTGIAANNIAVKLFNPGQALDLEKAPDINCWI